MLPIGSWNLKGSVRVFQISSQVMTWNPPKWWPETLAISSAKKKAPPSRSKTCKPRRCVVLLGSTLHWSTAVAPPYIGTLHRVVGRGRHAATRSEPQKWLVTSKVWGSKMCQEFNHHLGKDTRFTFGPFGSWAIAAPKNLTLKKTMLQGHQKNPRKQFRIVGSLSSHPSFDILQLQSQLKWDDHLPSVLGLAKRYLWVNLPESWSTFLSPWKTGEGISLYHFSAL